MDFNDQYINDNFVLYQNISISYEKSKSPKCASIEKIEELSTIGFYLTLIPCLLMFIIFIILHKCCDDRINHDEILENRSVDQREISENRRIIPERNQIELLQRELSEQRRIIEELRRNQPVEAEIEIVENIRKVETIIIRDFEK